MSFYVIEDNLSSHCPFSTSGAVLVERTAGSEDSDTVTKVEVVYTECTDFANATLMSYV